MQKQIKNMYKFINNNFKHTPQKKTNHVKEKKNSCKKIKIYLGM